MKKHKKKLILSIIIIIGLLLFFLLVPNNFTQKAYKENNQPIIKPENSQLNTQNKKGRFIASISPQKIKKRKHLNREIVGDTYDLNKIQINNKVNKDWKKKYESTFLRMTSEKNIKELKIKLQKSILKVKNNIGTNYEHIIVSYKKPNGHPFSFEALVDSETGSLVKTWNKTKYEFRKPAKIKGSKYLYKKEEL